MKASQKQRLREHFDKGYTITRLQAFNTLGIAELSSRIIELERDGYPIDRDKITVYNRFDEKVKVMRYKKQDG